MADGLAVARETVVAAAVAPRHLVVWQFKNNMQSISCLHSPCPLKNMFWSSLNPVETEGWPFIGTVTLDLQSLLAELVYRNKMTKCQHIIIFIIIIIITVSHNW